MPRCTVQVKIVNGSNNEFREKEIYVFLRQGISPAAVQTIRKGSTPVAVFNVDFTDANRFVVVGASAAEHQQTGVSGIELEPNALVSVLLILLPKRPEFDFQRLPTGLNDSSRAHWRRLLAGPNGNLDNLNRLQSKHLACLLNIFAALESAGLRDGKDLLGQIQEIKLVGPDPGLDNVPRWQGVRQDRIFVKCAKEIVAQITAAREFRPEPDLFKLHPPADSSFKENLYPEANLQFSFVTKPDELAKLGVAEGERDKVVLADIDMDLFRDGLAHVFLEVIPNKVNKLRDPKKGLTDPMKVGIARRMIAAANRHTFDPPYDIGLG